MIHTFTQRLSSNVLQLAPKISRYTLNLMPDKLKLALISRTLGVAFAEQVNSDELLFLEGKWVGICVEDIGLNFEVSYAQQLCVRALTQPNVTFSAAVPELLLVAAGKEDPDTLFFQRKLRIEGDTELGLEVKNLLLSIELDTLPAAFRIGIEKLVMALETLQKHNIVIQ